MKKLISITIVTVLMIFGLAAPGVVGTLQAESWQMFWENDDYAISFDEDSIIILSDVSAKVWCKTVAKSDKYRDFVIQFRREEGLPTAGFDQYAYTLSSEEVSCDRDRSRTLEEEDYAANDKKIFAAFPLTSWSAIHPDTPYALLLKVLCESVDQQGYWWTADPTHESHDEE